MIVFSPLITLAPAPDGHDRIPHSPNHNIKARISPSQTSLGWTDPTELYCDIIPCNLVVIDVAGDVEIINIAGEIKHNIFIFILNKITNIVNSKEFEDLLCGFIDILLA